MTAKELKASILQLAVTGKLVPQDPNDEPASVLLERIKAEKAKLVKAGKIKKDKNPPEIVTGSDGAVYEKFGEGDLSRAETQRRGEGWCTSSRAIEVPFEIPASWAWVKLRTISVFECGYAFEKAKYKKNGIQVVRISDLAEETISEDDAVFYDDDIALYDYLLKTKSILICLTGSIGKMAFVNDDKKRYLNQRIGMLTSTTSTDIRYCWYYLHCNHVISYWMDNKKSTNGNLRNSDIEELLFPLPPLAEQKRIVAKIEKLMPLVEEYGTLEETRLQLDADLPAMLEKSILQEAIQGKLVPQDPNNEPASELLKRIAAERKALVKAGKLKRDKTESVIIRGSDRLAYETRSGETVCIQDEIPFEIPDSWEWVRLGDMSNYGQCTSVDTADIAPDTWSLDLEEIEKGTGRLIERKTAAEKKSKSSKHVFTKGTLLYSKLRTYLNKVLVADMDGVCTSEIVPIELNGGVNAEYVRLVLMSPYFLEYTASKGYGIKMPRVGTDDMKQSLIPLPPLDEQKRIVKRVEELKATARTLVTF